MLLQPLLADGVMVLKVGHHKGGSAAQRDFERKRNFCICDSVCHVAHENKKRTIRPAGCGGRFRSRLIDVADQHHNAPIGCPQYTALTWAAGMVDAACVPGGPSVWTFLNRDS